MGALYNRSMKITTKTGDRGETSLFGGRRVSKASPYIGTLGHLDELQSYVGWARCALAESDSSEKVCEALDRMQDDIYRMMSIVGFEMKVPKTIQAICEKDVEFLESIIEAQQDKLKDLNKFIRPGSNEIAARLHIARSFCRRVERLFVADQIADQFKGAELIIMYLNRLSDCLFVLAYQFENV